MADLTFFHRIMDRINRPAVFLKKTDAPIWDKPYRAQIHHAPDGEKVKVSLPCARYYWVFLPYAFVLIGSPVILGAGFSMGFGFTRNYTPYWQPIPLLIALGIWAALFVLTLRIGYPRIVFEATRDGVTIGKYKFDWDNLGGLRLGYSAGGKEMAREQWGHTGLRMTYGAWGFDLPYMTPSYYAAAYVVWVNMLFDTIGKNPETMDNSPEEGFKKALF
jgi:hypothetical protein|tara:strand:+ start:728 stop:1381 length:654 start_codon:yes stop_codon:yes gene_type:complete